MPREAAENFFKTVKSFKCVETKVEHDEPGFESRVTIQDLPNNVLNLAFKESAKKIVEARNEALKRIHDSRKRSGDADREGPIKIKFNARESEEKPGGTLFEKGVKKLVYTFEIA